MTIRVAAADVARAFGREITTYDVQPIDPHLRLHSVTGGVFRVHVDADSAVLKVVRHGVDDDPGALWVAGAEPAHRNYWKREWLAFDSGLLDRLPGRLRAPHTWLTEQRADDECWIWMEDVVGRTGRALTDDDYRASGTDLGTTQGAFAAGAVPLPDDEWLSRDWLRAWCATSGAQLDALTTDEHAWNHPALADMRTLRERAMALWTRREELFAIAEEAPQTLVHLDFWPANLFRTPASETVAIDWSQVGIGTITQDLDQMTLDPVWMLVRPEADPRDLEEHVFSGYVDGLRDAGFHVERSVLWRWYAANAALKYLPLLELQITVTADPRRLDAQVKRFGRPYEEIAGCKASVVRRAVELGEEALGSVR